MSCKLNAFLRCSSAGIALLWIVLTAVPSSTAKTVYWGRAKKTVVLDPGHGGADAGARSSDGILEKQLALALSRQLVDQLGDAYRVRLTRSDDYWLDIDGRTDVANNLNADVFIGIHAAASFASTAKGICIYYYKETAGGNLAGAEPTQNTQAPLPVWDRLQLRHVHTSRMLAQSLRGQLSPLSQSTVLAAPLLVLRGADMPAVLIEVGYLSNPEDTRSLRDPRYLESLALAITDGVNAFFSELRQKQ
jgi:N-acetylmuramoyl-L-alanine amidase